MAWVEILPRYVSLLRRHGWDSASTFLAWSGILVNRHRHRQVEQVHLSEPEAPAKEGATFANASGSDSFFLKKEYAVSWRDRFHNAWHGFGWCATAVREAAVLQALREAGIGCPEVVALGEDGRQAFVLTCAESAMSELRAFLPTLDEAGRNRLAEALGRELAKMHDAGFEHPDLFAKHILAQAQDDSFRFCILDWQRGRRRRAVSWRLRCRDLAVLDATLHDALANGRLRLRCLRSYRQAVTVQSETPPLGRLARQIRAASERLREQRNIREIGQLPAPARDQQFVPVKEGRLLVVRSYYEKLGERLPEWLTNLTEPEAQTRKRAAALACAAGSELLLQTWPNAASARAIPPLAHTLFRLQRFGVPAPRLLAVGFSSAGVFLAAESRTSVSLVKAFAKAPFAQRSRMLRQAGAIVRQIHEAGYLLPPGDSWEQLLGVDPASGDILVLKVETLMRGNTRWQELAPMEFNRQKIRLSRAEQLRFMQGYLKQKGGNAVKAVSRARSPAWERQVVS